jgi:hypothetical protein
MYKAALFLTLLVAGCGDPIAPTATEETDTSRDMPRTDAGTDDVQGDGGEDVTGDVAPDLGEPRDAGSDLGDLIDAGLDAAQDAVVLSDVEPDADAGPRDARDDIAEDAPADTQTDTPDTHTDIQTDTLLDADPDPDATDAGTDLPVHHLDDELTLHDIQALGTHNSYHVQPVLPIPEWAYTHLPLDEQLGTQGVRQFELDLNWDVFGNRFRVFHVPVIDDVTTCEDTISCLAVLRSWSVEHPAHHPLLVMLEIKSGDGSAADQLAVLEDEILATWPREAILAPDDVRGAYGTLREAVTQAGWPTLGASRGKIIFVLHAGGGWRRALIDGAPSAEGRLLFPDTFDDADQPFAAFRSMNNPVGDGAAIADAVRTGFLVRTRADSNGAEARAFDLSRAQAAFDSGAHFVSTDFPYPATEDTYGVVIPGGTPSRCNPITAPDICTTDAVEDPRILAP